VWCAVTTTAPATCNCYRTSIITNYAYNPFPIYLHAVWNYSEAEPRRPEVTLHACSISWKLWEKCWVWHCCVQTAVLYVHQCNTDDQSWLQYTSSTQCHQIEHLSRAPFMCTTTTITSMCCSLCYLLCCCCCCLCMKCCYSLLQMSVCTHHHIDSTVADRYIAVTQLNVEQPISSKYQEHVCDFISIARDRARGLLWSILYAVHPSAHAHIDAIISYQTLNVLMLEWYIPCNIHNDRCVNWCW
jgi:hypothetical protein